MAEVELVKIFLTGAAVAVVSYIAGIFTAAALERIFPVEKEDEKGRK